MWEIFVITLSSATFFSPASKILKTENYNFSFLLHIGFRTFYLSLETLILKGFKNSNCGLFNLKGKKYQAPQRTDIIRNFTLCTLH